MNNNIAENGSNNNVNYYEKYLKYKKKYKQLVEKHNLRLSRQENLRTGQSNGNTFNCNKKNSQLGG